MVDQIMQVQRFDEFSCVILKYFSWTLHSVEDDSLTEQLHQPLCDRLNQSQSFALISVLNPVSFYFTIRCQNCSNDGHNTSIFKYYVILKIFHLDALY